MGPLAGPRSDCCPPGCLRVYLPGAFWAVPAEEQGERGRSGGVCPVVAVKGVDGYDGGDPVIPAGRRVRPRGGGKLVTSSRGSICLTGQSSLTDPANATSIPSSTHVGPWMGEERPRTWIRRARRKRSGRRAAARQWFLIFGWPRRRAISRPRIPCPGYDKMYPLQRGAGLEWLLCAHQLRGMRGSAARGVC